MRAVVRFAPYALVLGLAAFLVLTSRVVMGDSVAVWRGVIVIRQALAEGHAPRNPFNVAAHFPLYQYLPALALSCAGASEQTAMALFCALSFLAFVGSMALTIGVLRRRSAAAATAGVLVLVSGPLLWYSRASFGEMLAAFLILAYTAACLRGSGSIVTAVLFVCAAMTKETALPFLLLIAAVPLLVDRRAGRSWQCRQFAAILVAAVASAGLTAGFNYYRYGVPYNAVNLQDVCLVPRLQTQVSFFAAIWLSPNGGLLFFWPSFVVALVVLTAAVWRSPRAGGVGRIPLVGVAALLVLLTAGFSKWYQPFGWFAWGPRLMLPWVPAATVIILYYYAEEFDVVLARLSARPIRWMFALLVLAAATLPQAVVLVKSEVFWSLFTLPPVEELLAVNDYIGSYYAWLGHALWPRPGRVAILACYPAAVRELPTFLASLTLSLAVVGLGWQLRRDCRTGGRSGRQPGGITNSSVLAVQRADNSQSDPIHRCGAA
jgi:hypothetical protein